MARGRGSVHPSQLKLETIHQEVNERTCTCIKVDKSLLVENFEQPLRQNTNGRWERPCAAKKPFRKSLTGVGAATGVGVVAAGVGADSEMLKKYRTTYMQTGRIWSRDNFLP